MPSSSWTPVMEKVAPLVPTTLVAPVADGKKPAAHAPAVPWSDEPLPKLMAREMPIPFPVFQVPVVSPAIVTVLYSNVFAELIVNVNGYDLFASALKTAPPKVPVSELRTQKDSVTVAAPAAPHPRSATLKPSIRWLI